MVMETARRRRDNRLAAFNAYCAARAAIHCDITSAQMQHKCCADEILMLRESRLLSTRLVDDEADNGSWKKLYGSSSRLASDGGSNEVLGDQHRFNERHKRLMACDLT